ncbi:hypothetical protein [Mesorhizobium sp. B2-4-15]|uniref:hypothetical protein n=1 Tax=Mesorhizobium sp. B2-4-15 TaxID=2589934 RepID=UPI001FED7B73|nr:hypothetical protein [Mesorhizobium sp. B2-4-15]
MRYRLCKDLIHVDNLVLDLAIGHTLAVSRFSGLIEQIAYHRRIVDSPFREMIRNPGVEEIGGEPNRRSRAPVSPSCWLDSIA